MHLRRVIRLLAFCLVFASLFLVRVPINQYIAAWGITGVAGVVLWTAAIALAAILPIPSEPLMLANLRASGVAEGTVVNIVGTLLGAVILFIIGRLAASSVTTVLQQPRVRPLYERVQKRLRPDRFFTLVLVQLLPFPFLFINLLLGALRDIPFAAFLLASLAGMAPYQLAWSALYLGLVNVSHIWLYGPLTALAFIFIWLCTRCILCFARSRATRKK